MTNDRPATWLHLAFQRNVVLRGLKVAAVVGSILITINHLPALLAGDVGATRILQMGLTYLVPYCVSTWSSVAAIREIQRRSPGDHPRK